MRYYTIKFYSSFDIEVLCKIFKELMINTDKIISLSTDLKENAITIKTTYLDYNNFIRFIIDALMDDIIDIKIVIV